MSLNGTLLVSVAFTEAASSPAVVSQNDFSLSSITNIASGKVAVVSGTAGTAAVTVNVNPSAYKDANGNAVTLDKVTRVLLTATTPARAESNDDSQCRLRVAAGGIAVSSAEMECGANGFDVAALTGTTQFTLIMFGEDC